MKYYFQCPRCRNDEEFLRPSEETYPLGFRLFLFGGVLPALLFQHHTRHRIQCGQCTHIFQQPPIPRSPVAKFALWIIIATLLLFTAAIFYFHFPEFTTLWPSLPVIQSLEDAIGAHPRVAAYFIALLVGLMIISSWVAALVSNAAFRKHLSTQCRLEPRSPFDLEIQNRPASGLPEPHAQAKSQY